MRMERLAYRWLGLLALAAVASGACAGQESDDNGSDPVADATTARLQAELTAGTALNPATAASVRPVKPTLKCVDKLSSTSYKAHFGYVNTSSSSISIPVGSFYNRFFPNPTGRGQPTVYLAGTQPDVVQVTFSSQSFVAWVLGSGAITATKNSKLCPTGTGGATGAGGAVGTGGRGAGGNAGHVGVGGMGVGGAGQCPSTCDDRNPCTIDLCNASTGFTCTNVAARDGTVCDDGNACTISDTCVTGVCTPGLPKVCQALDRATWPASAPPPRGLLEPGGCRRRRLQRRQRLYPLGHLSHGRLHRRAGQGLHGERPVPRGGRLRTGHRRLQQPGGA